MDCFSRLPELVQTETFINVGSIASIMQLIRASPAMLLHYTEYRTCIMRGILSNILADDIDHDIVQDAFGIIYISNFVYARIYFNTHRWNFHKRHPFEQPEKIPKLYRLITRVIMFIEDYITKATDPFPPRAYLCLPEMATGKGRRFKGRTVSGRSVMFTDLTSSERYRLLRGFLRYELLCKLYQPRAFDQDDTCGRPHTRQRTCDRPLCAPRLPTFEKSQNPDLQLLCSVHEYYRGVYGAIFAHGQASLLPVPPGPFAVGSQSQQSHVETAPSSAQIALLYPDNLYLDADIYLAWILVVWRESLSTALPCLGLDLLTSVLRFLHKHRNNYQYIRSWLRTFDQKMSKNYLPWANKYLYSCGHERASVPYDASILSHGLRDLDRSGSLVRQYASRRFNYDHAPGDEVAQCLGVHHLQIRIYRQRAWEIFDNERLYMNVTHHFPTMDDLCELDDEADSRDALAYKQERTKSLKCQDWCAGRTSEDPRGMSEEEEYGKPLGDSTNTMSRFFEQQVSWKLPIFWSDNGNA